MRHLPKLILVIFLTACMDASLKETVAITPENSKATTVTLKDSLGKVYFSIHLHYDTSFAWTNHSDCGKPCDHEQYSFNQSHFQFLRKVGFIMRYQKSLLTSSQ